MSSPVPPDVRPRPRALGYLRLARVHNCAAAAMMTTVGAHLAAAEPFPTGTVARAAGATFLLVAACNAYNDLRDVREDQANAPARPLPSGTLRLEDARAFAALAALGGVAAAASLGAHALVAAAIAAALGAAYSRWLKSTVLVGNAVVGLLSGCTIAFGALVAGQLAARAVFGAALVALAVFFREILKTVVDREGDRRAHVTTIATRHGSARAVDAARLGAAASIAVSVLPALAPGLIGDPDRAYLWAVTLGTALPTAALIVALGRDPATARVRLSLRVTKAIWFVGVLSLALLRPR